MYSLLSFLRNIDSEISDYIITDVSHVPYKHTLCWKPAASNVFKGAVIKSVNKTKQPSNRKTRRWEKGGEAEAG